MATSHISPGKKTTSKTASNITAKKTLAKKVASTPARKVIVAKAANLLPAANKASRPSASMAAPSKKITSNIGVAKSSIAPEERYRMIAAAAYLRAERRGFASGHALDDWVAAEKEIDAMLYS